ncbi:MAG: PD-(D/E)XK motif protein [Spirochaetes bacterium]|nr:PD-(D/E)XK motif protein [Spirochaetota bacterium]
MKIDKIWEELEADNSLTSGLLYKRMSGQIKPDIYISIKVPEKLRCISVHLNKDFSVDLTSLNKIRDIKIDTLVDEKQTEKQFLLILLVDNQYKDLFSVLSEDLIKQVAEITDEKLLLNELQSRLTKWQMLFEKLGKQGLSEEAQVGLFGELYFLRQFLSYSNDYESCINLWKGPEKAIQDFQHLDWALEVKTTHGKNHQKIHIANERQLDTDIIPIIYLFHISVDVRDGTTETLNSLVDEVLETLKDNYSALSSFKLKLLDYGYFDVHRNLYSDTDYNIRNNRIFLVTNDFPRITERQVPGGVGDVRYSIVVPDEVPWRITPDELFHKIRQSHA